MGQQPSASDQSDNGLEVGLLGMMCTANSYSHMVAKLPKRVLGSAGQSVYGGTHARLRGLAADYLSARRWTFR